MPEILWPTTGDQALPANMLVSGYKETERDTALRTEMDAGPAKVRQRYTAAPYPLSGTINMRTAQTSALSTFYRDTTKGGTLPFTFKHPRTGQNVTVRFKKPPDYVPGRTPGRWLVSLQFEVMP